MSVSRGRGVVRPLVPWILSEVEYDGKTYSGSYGDLGAMASLLHPEARTSDVNAKYSGTLREPMVNVIHSEGRARRTHRVQTISECLWPIPLLNSLGPLLLRF